MAFEPKVWQAQLHTAFKLWSNKKETVTRWMAGGHRVALGEPWHHLRSRQNLTARYHPAYSSVAVLYYWFAVSIFILNFYSTTRFRKA